LIVGEQLIVRLGWSVHLVRPSYAVDDSRVLLTVWITKSGRLYLLRFLCGRWSWRRAGSPSTTNAALWLALLAFGPSL